MKIMKNGIMLTILNKISFIISIPSMKYQEEINYIFLSIVLHQCLKDYALYITILGIQFTLQINKKIV